jgi:hypothetical protein
MSDKVGKGVKGPVKLHKSMAAGESYGEAVASALGKSSGTHTAPPKTNKNTR